MPRERVSLGLRPRSLLSVDRPRPGRPLLRVSLGLRPRSLLSVGQPRVRGEFALGVTGASAPVFVERRDCSSNGDPLPLCHWGFGPGLC